MLGIVVISAAILALIVIVMIRASYTRERVDKEIRDLSTFECEDMKNLVKKYER